ncbi:MAG: LysR family transcriptional regulator [Bacteriovoracaceae bacterium]
MDYRYLRAFLYTSRFKSFSKAADELRIAQSAVSRQIKLLEESVGKELIIRSSKKVLLTELGEKLLESLSQFENQTDRIFELDTQSPLRIGILEGLMLNWFPPILSKVIKKLENSVEIQIKDVSKLKEGLEKNQFDAVLTTNNIQSEIITSRQLFNEKLVLISKNEINKKKLHESPWIVYGDNDYLFQYSKKVSDRVLKISHLRTIINLVRSGHGVAIVPAHVLKKNDNLNVSEISLPGQINKIYFATLNYRQLPKHLNLLLEQILAQLQITNR